MQVWNVRYAARCKYRTQKKSPKIAIWAQSHNFVGPYLCNQGTYRQSEKFVKQQYVLHMSTQHGEFRPTSVEVVWGTPANFSGFRVLAALLHGSGHQPNFALLNRERHLCSAGRLSRWALAHILVFFLQCTNRSCSCWSVGRSFCATRMSHIQKCLAWNKHIQ